MVGRDDEALANVLQEMAHVMAQATQAFQSNQNVNNGAGEFQGLSKFQKNNPLLLKGGMTLMVHKNGFRRSRRFLE